MLGSKLCMTDIFVDLSASSSEQIEVSNGSFTLQNNTNEQDMIGFIKLLDNLEISFDLSILVQEATIRLYERVDGINYRVIDSGVFPTNFPVGAKLVVLSLNGKNQDMKVTIQSSIAEGAPRSISHSRVEVVRMSV